jgi:DeoR/GlpR family transcriptional regulator of sugar metabolism
LIIDDWPGVFAWFVYFAVEEESVCGAHPTTPTILKLWVVSVDYRDESDAAFQNVLSVCVEGYTPALREILPIKSATYFDQRARLFREAKRAIGARIVSHYLTDGDPILLDAGSSLSSVAEEIAAKGRRNPSGIHHTIFTHNLSAFLILAELSEVSAGLNLILAGGRYDVDLNAFLGQKTVLTYEDCYPRVVVMGISGLSANLGLFCRGNTEELPVKKAIFHKGAEARIIVADYSKIGTRDAHLSGEAHHLSDNVDRSILVTNKPPR